MASPVLPEALRVGNAVFSRRHGAQWAGNDATPPDSAAFPVHINHGVKIWGLAALLDELREEPGTEEEA